MKCKECNYEFENAKFCPECGKPVASNKIMCTKCGHEIDSNLKFCPECGKPVLKEYQDKHDKDKNYRDKRYRDRRGDDDDEDEGGIFGGIGDVIGGIFGK